MEKQKILIVDDAQYMRMMIRDIVTSMDLEVVGEAADGGDGFEKFKELKPDLVTMDLVMPKVGGLEGLKLIKEHNPQAKVIVVTAIDQRESLIQAIKSGAADFIIKPFEEERVTNAIKKALNID